jgi:tetratricopeptide (TPR) repeat protein
MLNKLLNINQNDSLILCYRGEVLSNLERHNESLIHLTKAHDIDPENIHILIKRGITYYNLQEYDNALIDFNKVKQMDSSNSMAYFCKVLVYHIINDAMVKKNRNNDLTKMEFYFLLLDNIEIKYWQNIIAKINQFLIQTNDNELLLFIRCIAYIKLKEYGKARIDLGRLIRDDNILFTISLLQKYSDFWSYLYDEIYKTDDNEYTDLGIVKKFNIYMFKGMCILKFIII